MIRIDSHVSRVVRVNHFPILVLLGIGVIGYASAVLSADESSHETVALPPTSLTAEVVDSPVHAEHPSGESHSHADRIKNIVSIRQEHEQRQLEHERQFRAQVEFAREQVRIHMERRAADAASKSFSNPASSEIGTSETQLRFYGWSRSKTP